MAVKDTIQQEVRHNEAEVLIVFHIQGVETSLLVFPLIKKDIAEEDSPVEAVLVIHDQLQVGVASECFLQLLQLDCPGRVYKFLYAVFKIREINVADGQFLFEERNHCCVRVVFNLLYFSGGLVKLLLIVLVDLVLVLLT